MPSVSPSQSPTRIPTAAMPRPAQAGDARQTSRNAMTANDSGSTSWAIQTGTPAAIVVPSSMSSSLTIWTFVPSRAIV